MVILAFALSLMRMTYSWPLAADVGDHVQNVRISESPLGSPQNQPTIAINPGRFGNIVVGAHQFPPQASAPVGASAAYFASFDGGKSYPHQGILPGLTLDSGGNFAGASDPSVACGPNGICYYSTYAYELANSHSAITISRTLDGGKTWTNPVVIDERIDPYALVYKGSLAVDSSWTRTRNRVYIAYVALEFDESGVVGTAIYVASSHNAGQSWSAPQRVSPPTGFDFLQAPRVAVDPDGRVSVVYINFLDEAFNRHIVQRSSDGGRTWNSPVEVSAVFDTFAPLPPARFRVHSWPMFAANPLSGALHVAWSDERYGSPDILVASSVDGGTTWTEPVRANDTPQEEPIEHALPSLACGPQGICAVSFLSSKNNPESGWLDVYTAFVGARYSPNHPSGAQTVVGNNVRITETSFSSDVNFNGRFIGDYAEMAIDWLSVHPAWTDTRIIESAVSQQDVFSANLALYRLFR